MNLPRIETSSVKKIIKKKHIPSYILQKKTMKIRKNYVKNFKKKQNKIQNTQILAIYIYDIIIKVII